MNRNSAQSIASLLGVVLIVIGILGFIPDVTVQNDSIAFAGQGSEAKLIGVFQVSVLLNLIWIAIGIAGIVLAKTPAGARGFLIGGGIVCLGLWMLGLAHAGKWIPVNAADDWLQLGLGVALLGLGFATRESIRTQTA